MQDTITLLMYVKRKSFSNCNKKYQKIPSDRRYDVTKENQCQSFTRLRVCINVFLFIFCVEERLQSHGYILSMR